jgi:hypothetical protein
MKIKFAERGKNFGFWESFKQMFYIGFYELDEADLGFYIVLFSYEFNWLIYKNKASFSEYQQMEYDSDARYLKWQYDNCDDSCVK